MTDSNFPSSEYQLLSTLRNILGRAANTGGAYELTLGDDAAIRQCRCGERVVLTTDIAVEDVHFTLDTMTFPEIGYRTMAANVSDCAAMAAIPEAALVQLVFPKGDKNLQKNIRSLYRGFAEACRAWNFKLIGGDLAGGDAWTIGITMLGTAPAKGRLLRRKGARAGDALWISGFPGRSAAGLAAIRKWGRASVPEQYLGLVARHVRPVPRVALGLALGRCKKVHALMDLSDGISKDGRTLCYENRLGLELSIDKLEPPPAMAALSRELGIPWQEWALHGGEEYDLLFAASKAFCPAKGLPGKAGNNLLRLGNFTDKNMGFVLRDPSGRTKKIGKGSWDHLAMPNPQRK